jgi:hypothetical protein
MRFLIFNIFICLSLLLCGFFGTGKAMATGSTIRLNVTDYGANGSDQILPKTVFISVCIQQKAVYRVI